MKTYTWLLIFLSIVSRSVSFSQENFIYDVHMFDSSNIAVLGFDFLRRSTDGGYSWLNQISPNEYNLSFSFLSDSVGFASANTLLKTTNYGNEWLGTNSIDLLQKISFLDTKNGYAVRDFFDLYKTTDGGVNWSHNLYSGNNELLCVSFVDNLRGMVSNSWGIRITTDGGDNWTPPSGIPQMNVHSIWLFDEKQGAAVGWGIYRTTDFGISWETVIEPNEYSFRNVFFLDSIIGFTVGGLWDESSGIILNTTDGGVTWAVQTDELDYMLLGVHFYNREIGMAVGQWGAIYKTIDGGKNWRLISIPTNVVSEDDKPKYFQLSQNYPNPFNPTTTISYSVSKPGFVTLNVYDILGNEITTLVSEEKIAGSYEVKFDGRNLASGIYIYRLTSGKFNASKKLILLK